jgi:hypothetical protein
MLYGSKYMEVVNSMKTGDGINGMKVGDGVNGGNEINRSVVNGISGGNEIQAGNGTKFDKD